MSRCSLECHCYRNGSMSSEITCETQRALCHSLCWIKPILHPSLFLQICLNPTQVHALSSAAPVLQWRFTLQLYTSPLLQISHLIHISKDLNLASGRCCQSEEPGSDAGAEIRGTSPLLLLIIWKDSEKRINPTSRTVFNITHNAVLLEVTA